MEIQKVYSASICGYNFLMRMSFECLRGSEKGTWVLVSDCACQRATPTWAGESRNATYSTSYFARSSFPGQSQL